MTEFVKGSYILGRVKNISPTEVKDYKIIVYVLTDKWYIHPYARDTEGFGYAKINSDGTWKIPTVFRGYQSYRTAFLLTQKSMKLPLFVEVVTNNPDQDLLVSIDYKKELIIKSPEGI